MVLGISDFCRSRFPGLGGGAASDRISIHGFDHDDEHDPNGLDAGAGLYSPSGLKPFNRNDDDVGQPGCDMVDFKIYRN